ncbi:MAG: hypothetical protein HRF45_12440 [Fimbriimonadia bacterium]
MNEKQMATVWTASQLETALAQLRSIVSARVIMDAQNGVREIHALTEGDRTPKQVVRDIESALQARFGLQVDHKTISIAQVEDRSYLRGRLRLVEVSHWLEGRRARASVQVERHGRLITGKAEGQRSSFNLLRLLSEATIDVVERACGLSDRFALQDLTTNVSLGGRQVVVVALSLVSSGPEEVLTGSALVQDGDVHRAVVHATLDALNRRLERLPTEATEEADEAAEASLPSGSRFDN